MSIRMMDLLASAWSELRYEPVERRVRADEVVESTRAVFVWEPRRVVPSYAVPEEDIRAELEPAEASAETVDGVLHPGIAFGVHTAQGQPVTIAGRPAAGLRLADPDLKGYVALDFRAFDAWYEEDERIYGHPRDPFARVDVRQTSRPLRVESNGEVLAKSTRARLVYETGLPTRFYIPKEDVRGTLQPSDRRSYCPYKGEASYWSLNGYPDILWSYEEPLPDQPALKGLVAFWNERVDIVFDGERRDRPSGPIAAALKDEFGV